MSDKRLVTNLRRKRLKGQMNMLFENAAATILPEYQKKVNRLCALRT